MQSAGKFHLQRYTLSLGNLPGKQTLIAKRRMRHLSPFGLAAHGQSVETNSSSMLAVTHTLGQTQRSISD